MRKIIKLDERHRDSVLKYLHGEKEYNIFIIGDIENFGFQSEFQDVWAEMDKTGITGVLLRYHDTFICYSQEHYNAEKFASIINSFDRKKTVMGKTVIISKVLTHLSQTITEERHTIFTRLEKLAQIEMGIQKKAVKAVTSDIERLQQFYRDIDEFRYTDESFDRIVETNIKDGAGRCFFVSMDNTIAAAAMSTAESSSSAMIMGVATRPRHRKGGYATACVTMLCSDLARDNKAPCLIYDNPEAGAIYHKIGFRKMGTWMMCVLQ